MIEHMEGNTVNLKITLEFGNEAMQTTAQAVAAIKNSIGWRGAPKPDSGSLMDLNGNKVGKWELVADAPAADTFSSWGGMCKGSGRLGAIVDGLVACPVCGEHLTLPQSAEISTDGTIASVRVHPAVSTKPAAKAERNEGDVVTFANGSTAVWSRETDHTGHIPAPSKVWYLRCVECAEEVETGGNGCNCQRPPDPEGQNSSRANAALGAVVAFAADFGELPQEGSLSDEGNAALLVQNVSDLLCDLAHLADRRNFNLAACWQRAASHYMAETGNEGIQMDSIPQ